MPLPTTDAELKANGYLFQGESHCRGCGAIIRWYVTPKAKWMPFDTGTLIPHWTTCPNAKDFKKPTRK